MLLSYIGALASFSILTMAKTFSPIDLVTLPRPSGVISDPSGKFGVYSESQYIAKESKSQRSIYIINLETSKVQPLTTPVLGETHSEPFFLDESHVAYLWSKPDQEVAQLYVVDIEGKQEPYAITDFPISFENLKYNRERQLLAFSAYVYTELDTLADTKQKDDHIKETKKDTALVYDQLMIRHWDTYVTSKRNNIFITYLEVVDGKYKLKTTPRNLLQNTDLQSPGFPSGDASDYDISKDGNELAFVSKITSRDNAWQTSQYVYTLRLDDEAAKPIALNDDIPAASSGPVYAPKSGRLAYLQMKTPQYESDKNRIVIYNKEKEGRIEIVTDWDRSPSELIFSQDESTLYAVAQEFGRSKLFAIDLTTQSVTTLTNERSVSGVSVISDHELLFTVNSMNHPNIVHTFNTQTNELKRHDVSDALKQDLNSFSLRDPEEFQFKGALGDNVHGWIIKPFDFDENKKYPVADIIHGGPQSAFNDNWSTRWNPQVFANAGFVVILINSHGSTGYGQKFCDSIGKNWFTHPHHDQMIGMDYVLENYSYLDADNVVALGASYGGTAINYINGHTNRFKALVNHDGIFNTVNAYYTTEELYFPETEFGGPAFNPIARINYERFSPSNYVHRWKTPTLIIHGGRDYRLVDGEGFSTFTALQRLNVPSRLVYFPDESHWVLKPANSLKWHEEVLGWIIKYTTKESEDNQTNLLKVQQ